MEFITISLSGISIPENADFSSIVDILSDLRDKVLELSLNEFDKKFESDIWYFISRTDMPNLPDPILRIFMEVNDYYNYPDLSNDVIKTFEKHWEILKLNNS